MATAKHRLNRQFIAFFLVLALVSLLAGGLCLWLAYSGMVDHTKEILSGITSRQEAFITGLKEGGKSDVEVMEWLKGNRSLLTGSSRSIEISVAKKGLLNHITATGIKYFQLFQAFPEVDGRL